jgi:hypothetical protein
LKNQKIKSSNERYHYSIVRTFLFAVSPSLVHTPFAGRNKTRSTQLFTCNTAQYKHSITNNMTGTIISALFAFIGSLAIIRLYNLHVEDVIIMHRHQDRFYSLLNKMYMKHAELIQALTALKEQSDRATAEIVAKIASLEEALNNAGEVPAEVVAALDALKASVQTTDDVVAA